MIARAFDECGVRSSTLSWQLHSGNPLDLLRSQLSKGYVARRDDDYLRANAAALEREVMGKKPDNVLVMNGGIVTEATRRYCDKSGTKLVLWAYDNIDRFRWIAEHARDYDMAYTYEPQDVKPLSELTPTKYLPLAYDPEVYRRLPGSDQKETDLCFVGSVAEVRPERRRLLGGIARGLPELRIEIWSDTKHWYSPFKYQQILAIRSGRNLDFRLRTAEHSEINELYNRSKICLNIHHPQSRGAVNPRSFEILGSGGLLLTDRKMDGVELLEEGRDYVCYSSLDDVLTKVNAFVADGERRMEIAESGHSIAERAHTYKARASTILDDLRTAR